MRCPTPISDEASARIRRDCDRLSSARAASVADYLNDKGIDRGRIASKGYGKREPIATNSTVVGRRKNQRVELKVLEI